MSLRVVLLLVYGLSRAPHRLFDSWKKLQCCGHPAMLQI